MTASLFRNVKHGEDPEVARVAPIKHPASEHIYGETSWDGGKSWFLFSAWLPLLRIRLAVDEKGADEVWDMTDYPGMEGDWSAIRDSSPESIRAMEQVAKKYVSDAELRQRLGLTRLDG